MSSILKEKEYTSEKFDLNLWKKIIKILMEHKKHVYLLILFNVFIAMSDVIFPLMNRSAINDFAINKGQDANLTAFCIFYVIMIIFKCFSLFMFFQFAGHIESDFGKNLRKKCFDRVQQYFNNI